MEQQPINLDVLNIVKYRAGVLYSDPAMDLVFQSMIQSCRQYLRNAGVAEYNLETALAVDAYALWCKMQMGSDIKEFCNHPMLVNLVCQLRTMPPVGKIDA